jgi:hypothetical protein
LLLPERGKGDLFGNISRRNKWETYGVAAGDGFTAAIHDDRSISAKDRQPKVQSIRTTLRRVQAAETAMSV